QENDFAVAWFAQLADQVVNVHVRSLPTQECAVQYSSILCLGLQALGLRSKPSLPLRRVESLYATARRSNQLPVPIVIDPTQRGMDRSGGDAQQATLAAGP